MRRSRERKTGGVNRGGKKTVGWRGDGRKKSTERLPGGIRNTEVLFK
jgi:hypothetical protein